MQSRRSLLAQLLTASSFTAALLPAVRSVAQSAAPEFTGIDGWLNATAPLTLAGLRGKVVLVDFWTYSCINCRRTVPYLNRWQAEYGAKGLQVVGIHTPEFGFERARHNVADAVHEFGIRYPVGQDNDFRTCQTIEVGRPTLYTLFDGTTYAEHMLGFEAATPGLSLFSATFG
jgi:thiol-disulfide isomerase/thioredoxin